MSPAVSHRVFRADRFPPKQLGSSNIIGAAECHIDHRRHATPFTSSNLELMCMTAPTTPRPEQTLPNRDNFDKQSRLYHCASPSSLLRGLRSSCTAGLRLCVMSSSAEDRVQRRVTCKFHFSRLVITHSLCCRLWHRVPLALPIEPNHSGVQRDPSVIQIQIA